MPLRKPRPIHPLPAWRARPSPNAVHSWRKRIALAFALPACAPDPQQQALAAALRALKSANEKVLGAVRDQLVSGRLGPEAAAEALAAEAELCIARALSLSLDSTKRRYGPAPGRCAVIALGKLGGRELSFGSDLDLILVFERSSPAYCPQSAAWFEELARGLIGALAHPPGTQRLYEVDMRLRPHGADGPLAVELSAFAAYYQDTCWTWELQALTRARVVAGDGDLGSRTLFVIAKAIDHGLGLSDAQRLADVAKMRRLLDLERPAASPWDVKRAAGGLVDIEFIAQGLQLIAGGGHACLPQASTRQALETLAACGLLAPHDAQALIQAWSLQFLILQYQRALGVNAAALVDQPRRRLAALLRSANAKSLLALDHGRATAQGVTRKLFNKLIVRASVLRLAA